MKVTVDRTADLLKLSSTFMTSPNYGAGSRCVKVSSIVVVGLIPLGGGDERQVLGYREDRHRLVKPTMGVGAQHDPAALGKEQGFSHADRGEKELSLAGLHDMSCRIAEPVRIKKTPQPDMRIDQQPI